MTHANAPDTETVLLIGAEGGSLSVKRLRAPDGTWRFQAVKNEVALVEMLGDEGRGLPGIANVGPGATSCREALRDLDRYPWPKLTLITVHRDVAADVLDAVRSHRVSGPDDVVKWEQRLARVMGRAAPRVGVSPRFERALQIAAVVHAEQSRKGTRVPYITHPVQVARLLEQDGQPEPVVLAGFLHDVLEDAKDNRETRDRIRAVFPACPEIPEVRGALQHALAQLIDVEVDEETRRLVEAVTEVKTDTGQKRPWKTRKLEQLRHLRVVDSGVAALKAADALHNVESILADVEAGGAEVFSRFNASIDDTLWCYGTVAALVAERLEGTRSRLAVALDNAVGRLTAAADATAGPREPFNGHRIGAVAHLEDTTLVVVGSNRHRRIHSPEQWRTLAKPARGDAHWKPGRSAMELARAWFADVEATVPRDLQVLLDGHDATRGVRFATAFPERETPLDDLGKGRQHDMILCGRAGDRSIVVAIEAKADESFGSRIASCLRIADRENNRAKESGRLASRLPERIDRLSRIVFGRPVDQGIGRLRYQLLHGIAGTLLEAGRLGATQAAFVVHEFTGTGTRANRLLTNQQDLDAFLRALGAGVDDTVTPGKLIGPFFLNGPDAELNRLALFVGKTRTVLTPVEGQDVEQ